MSWGSGSIQGLGYMSLTRRFRHAFVTPGPTRWTGRVASQVYRKTLVPCILKMLITKTTLGIP